VETTVDETDIGRVSVGQEATFTVDAYSDDNFSGTVSQIRLAPQSIQNVVNYIVIIDVQNNQLKLMPGMTANVKILVAGAKNVVRVSNMALRFQPPNDIIDTNGTGLMRGSSRSKGAGFSDSQAMTQTSIGQNLNTKDNQGTLNQNRQSDGSGMQGTGFSPDERARFIAVRDSIQKANGGKLSQEELRGEMRKLFAGRVNKNNTQVRQTKPKVKVKKESNTYSIISSYPEYEKGAYELSEDYGRGRLWILKSNGKLEAVFVRTGLNDGRYTEISSTKLKPGDQVVLGVIANGDSGNLQTRSPLTGTGQQRGGGFR
jgi:HlyD family secretion protein